MFGSEAYVHVPKQLRKKWDKKSQKMILVNYQCDSYNYRLYNPHWTHYGIQRHHRHETNEYSSKETNDEIPIDINSSAENVEDEEENDTENNEEEKVNSQENVTPILRDRYDTQIAKTLSSKYNRI